MAQDKTALAKHSRRDRMIVWTPLLAVLLAACGSSRLSSASSRVGVKETCHQVEAVLTASETIDSICPGATSWTPSTK
jgi:hypothetical protein